MNVGCYILNNDQLLKRKSMRINLIVAAIMMLSTTVACKKTGTLQTETGILKADIMSYWTDPEALAALTINTTLVIDSMGAARSGANGRIVDKAEGKQRLRLKNLRTGNFWLDTLLDTPDQYMTITLLQLESGAQPVLVNKEIVSPDTRNLGFSFSDPNLPASMVLEFFAVKMNGRVPESGMDVPIAIYDNLKRGVFTGFLPISSSILTSSSYRFLYKLKDAATNEYLPNAGTIDPVRFQTGGRIITSSSTFEKETNHIFTVTRKVQTTGTINYSSARIVAY